MNNTIKALIIILTLFHSTIVLGDTLSSKDEAKELARTIMSKVETGNTSEALDLMKPYLIIPLSEFDVMKNQLSLQAPIIEQRFGATLGVELADVQEVGESLMSVMYIQKFEKHLMRWRFYFYKPKEGWVLNTFKTDDSIQLMFEGH